MLNFANGILKCGMIHPPQDYGGLLFLSVDVCSSTGFLA